MQTSSSPDSSAAASAARSASMQRVTLVAIVTNVVLTTSQLIVGLFANAFSLVADAVHTLTDLITDTLVLFAGRKGAQPADRDHPYGHARIETVVSLTLGITLMLVGIGFLWSASIRLQNMSDAAPLHSAALFMALTTLIIKELLFRFTLAASRRLKAPILEANAWHARSDAASSLVVAIGIGGSLAGYPFLEPMAAALVGFLIASMGIKLAWRAVRELIDTGLSEERIAQLRATILATPGVIDLHDLRTRRMASHVVCDTHVRVNSHITVSEGHAIANAVSTRIREAYVDIHDILVHIDVEDDSKQKTPPPPLPHRSEILQTVRGLVGHDLPDETRLQLHYLNNCIEVDVLLPANFRHVIETLAPESRIAALQATQPVYRRIAFFVYQAP